METAAVLEALCLQARAHVGNLDPLNTWVVVVVVVVVVFVANRIVDIVMLIVMNTFILPDVVMFRVLNTIDELCLC